MKGSGARLRDELRRVPPWAWALVFAIVLCLPRLARFGFWDPWELKLAEQARDVARSGHLFDPTAGGHYPGGHGLSTLLSAIGIALFGASELGARLPIALSAIGALMAVYWAGRSLLRPRAALLATLALGTMPLFVLESRQLTSDAPLIATLALALGGFGRFAWPPDGKRRPRDLAIAIVSIALGIYAGGALLGFVLPVLAIVASLIIGYGLKPTADAAAITDGTAPLSEPGVGRDVPADRALGATTIKPGVAAFFPLALLGAVAVTLLLVAVTHLVAGKYSWLLGGVPRSGAPTKTFEALIKQLGFGLFPWSAVAIFALARPLTRLDGDAGATNSRLAFVSLYLLVFAGLGFALSGYLTVVQGDVRYVALPAIALALGAFLDEALEGNSLEPVAGLVMMIGTLIIARDFTQDPEELASVHVMDKVKWPPTIAIAELVFAVGFIAAAGLAGGLAARARALGKFPRPAKGSRGRIGRAAEDVYMFGGRFGLQISIACAILFSFYLAQRLVPRLSTHLSFKPVLESYTKFAHGGEKIGKYRIEGHGSTFYSKQTMVDLPSQERVVQFLRDPARVFAMVPADELAALDAAFKQARVPYYVVDASSSRFLLLTNQLAP
ncbi:MAG TPA: glycosyltransferase family 39 protein [Vicinamibacterales bacterium]|nr:glycosyltransferase family 39 protein [Vicinamibacterales bacterium]